MDTPQPDVVTDEDAVESTKQQPAVDQESIGQRAGAAGVLQALEGSVGRNRELPQDDPDFQTLAARLQPILESELFLQLSIRNTGFYSQGRCIGPASELPALHGLLNRSGIEELIIKHGVSSTQLQRFVYVLKNAEPLIVDRDRFAACLWEADTDHIVYRFRDEPCLPEAHDPEPFDQANTPLKHVDELSADPGAEHTMAALSDVDGWGRMEDVPEHVQEILEWKPADEARSRILNVANPQEETKFVSHRLLQGWLQETQDERNSLRETLSLFCSCLLQQREWQSLIHLFSVLQYGLEEGASADSSETVEPGGPFVELWEELSGQVIEESQALRLGEALDRERSHELEFHAIEKLLGSLHPGVIDVLCGYLGELEDLDARKYVCRVLAACGAKEPGNLARRAADQPWFVVRNMAYVLGRIGGPKVLAHLRSWSRHEDVRVRAEVVRALGRVDHSGASQLLSDSLSDPEPRVRQAAVWALGLRRDRTAMKKLHEVIMNDRDFRNRPLSERDDVFRAYGRLADESAFEELEAWASMRVMFAAGWKRELRRGAVIALGECGHPAALEVLEPLMATRDAKLKIVVQTALAEIQNRRDLEAVEVYEEASFRPFEVTDSMVDTAHGSAGGI